MITRVCVIALGVLAGSVSGIPSLAAQSITAGALRGTVMDAEGAPLSGAAVTVESSTGAAVRNLETRDDGTFGVRMMLPGTYRILVEVVGYQPVRRSGIVVASGRSTTVSFTLEKRPPPITSVTEITQPGTSSGAMGRIVGDRELRALDYRRDATDLSRGVTEVSQPRDGRSGFAEIASGLPGSRSRLFVDGIPEQLIRHPGVPGEPASSPVFQRDGVEQAQIFGSAPDAEWRGVAGSILGLQTRSGSNKVQIAPFATYSSAKLGGNSQLNPADSAASSFQFGAILSGALVPDTAHYFFRGDYQSLQTASAFPWESDTSSYRGQLVSLRQTLPLIGTDTFHTQLGSGLAPVVRTWKGGSGFGRLDWQLSSASAVLVRAGFTSWKETNPALGTDPANGAGSALKARDITAAVSLTSTGASLSNELRVGFSSARRDWTSASLPATALVGEGIGISGNPALPGLFDTGTLSIGDGIQYVKGRHAIKTGLSIDYVNHRQTYRYGAEGVFLFGDLDRFGAAQGTFYQAVATSAEAKFASPEIGLYLEDAFSVSPELSLLFGLRYQTQSLPKNKIGLNQAWLASSGIRNDSLPKDRRGIQPRFGFVWDVQSRGEWVVQGSAGIYSSGLDPATFAEAMLYDGDVTVKRGQGKFTGWPAVPNATLAPSQGPALTFFSGGKNYHAPRTLKGDIGVSRALRGGVMVQVIGSYHHTDYLLRRADLNRSPNASGLTQESRPVYGRLVQQGSLVSGAPGIGRRFQAFDIASGLAPTGFSDHYEVTASVDRQVARGISLMASYTYSRTRDNMIGVLSPDPADQFSPFPEGINGLNWDEARSDLDIPHRVAGSAEYRSGGKYPVDFGVRGRFRSGLPFTPGFRRGVDVNGDLSGNNDPVQSGSIPTATGDYATCDGGDVGGFAERNSCRDKAVGALDLHFAVHFPMRGSGSSLAFIVDAFNLVSSVTGIVDHAAMLIDPAKTLTTDVNGGVTLPLLANPHFGSLLSRRGEPRLVRFGLRVEY
ncbi:MAG TPA: TonB-dependent receptor [Gemmatimonadales bacterium]|nr:TonB-dependent receptor [Gemmatimonadales bacterium]